MTMHLHNNLKLLRKRKGHTADVVACALDVKRSTLSAWENGAAEPRCTHLVVLSDYYKVPLDDLLRTDLDQLGAFKLDELQRTHTN